MSVPANLQNHTLNFIMVNSLQVRNALSDIAKKEGIDESPQSIFAFLIERVRANLHVVLCMSPVGEPFRYVVLAYKNCLNNEHLILEKGVIEIDTAYLDIMKTGPCHEYPLKPHFCTAKLGYAGVYLFFLFLLQNIDCGYSLEPPRRGGSNVYPQAMF